MYAKLTSQQLDAVYLCLYLCLHVDFSSLGPAEVQERQECQYGENCTFAYCQEEIDVWTQERKGALSRELLFDPLGSTERRALSVTRLLQLHMGMFMFLCEVRSQSVRLSYLFSAPLAHCNKTLTYRYLLYRNVLTVSLELSANAAKKT